VHHDYRFHDRRVDVVSADATLEQYRLLFAHRRRRLFHFQLQQMKHVRSKQTERERALDAVALESKRRCDDRARNRSQLSRRRCGLHCPMNGLTAIRRAFSYQTEHRLPTAGRPLQRPEAAQ
jgi:hypothetical protein